MKNKLLWLFSLLLVCALTMPRLVQHGMFMDGQLYGMIAHNLSKGIGSFWLPSWNPNRVVLFDQQPPLTFGIQALWFQLTGSSRWAERSYSFLFLLISITLLHLIWRQLHTNENQKKLSWLPVIFWMLIPISSWSFCNNMEEVTMGVFVLAAILFFIKSIQSKNKFNIYSVIGGAMMVMAWLCKGFPGLYPFAAFGFAFLFIKNFSWQDAAARYLTVVITLLIFFSALYLYPPAKYDLSTYLHNRVLNSIQHVSNVNSRFYLWSRLVQELLIVLSLCFIFLGYQYFKKQTLQFQKSYTLIFIALGLSGTLPLIVTLEQRGFYMCTALPCFAIAAALLVSAQVEKKVAAISPAFIFYLKIICCVAAIAIGISVFLLKDKFIYNQRSLPDVYQFGKIIPAHTIIGLAPDLQTDWSTSEYFARYYFIEVTTDSTWWNSKQYVIIDNSRTTQWQPMLSAYQKVPLQTLQFDLYKRK